ncbi:MAG: hypothetical protein NTW31_07410 [Bacteroidetes bacterium]|nr:hypothetical protein [Bacteroidota bacterium]
MKQLMIAFCLIVLVLPATWAQTTWKASDYKPEPYRKVMVLAKISDVTARRQLENNTVKFLNDKGIVAIPAYLNVKKTDGVSREAFLVIADSLQVDALLIYSVNGAEKHAENTPTVSVGVGVGGYGGYAAASVPISGGAKMVTVVKLSVYFYNRASLDEQWAQQLSGTLEDGTDKLAYTFAKTTVKAMFKDGLFITKK